MHFLEPYSQYNVSLNAITSVGNGTKFNRTARTNESSMYIFIVSNVFNSLEKLIECFLTVTHSKNLC